MENATAIVVNLVAAFLGGGIFVFIYNLIRSRAQNQVDRAHASNETAQAEKGKAEAEKTLGEAWANLYANLERRVNHLECVLSERDELIDDLTLWAEKLVKQLLAHDIQPEPFVRRRTGQTGDHAQRVDA